MRNYITNANDAIAAGFVDKGLAYTYRLDSKVLVGLGNDENKLLKVWRDIFDYVGSLSCRADVNQQCFTKMMSGTAECFARK